MADGIYADGNVQDLHIIIIPLGKPALPPSTAHGTLLPPVRFTGFHEIPEPDILLTVFQECDQHLIIQSITLQGCEHVIVICNKEVAISVV